MHDATLFSNASYQPAADAGASVSRGSMCSPLFVTLHAVCANGIFQITAGVAGQEARQLLLLLLKPTGLLTGLKSNACLLS